MKRIIATVLVIVLATGLWAGEREDLTVCLGLYRDASYNLAASELNRFISTYPKGSFNTQASYLLADTYLKLNTPKQALPLFNDLYKQDLPADLRPRVELGLGQALFLTQQYAQARKVLDKFVVTWVGHDLQWKGYYFLGRVLSAQNDLRTARSYYERARTLSGDPLLALARMQNFIDLQERQQAAALAKELSLKPATDEYTARALSEYANYLLTIEDYTQLAVLSPNLVGQASAFYTPYRTAVGAGLYYTGQYGQALELLQNLSSNQARFFTAQTLIAQDQPDEAKQILIDLKDTAPGEDIRANSFFRLAELEAQTNPAAAANLLEEFLQLNPDHPLAADAWYQTALYYHQQQNWLQAINALEQATNLQPTPELQEKVVFLRAECEFARGAYAVAASHYDTCANEFAQGKLVADSRFKAALSLYFDKQPQQAAQRFEQFLNDYPGSDRQGIVWFYLGETAIATQNWPLAITRLNTAADFLDDPALAWERLARVYYVQADYAKAMQTLEEVPDNDSYGYSKALLAGNISFAQKNYLQARDYYLQAVDKTSSVKLKEDAQLRLARAYYQLKDFSSATAMYRKLSAKGSSSKKFLLLAAESAFSAEDYTTAGTLYQQFISNYPNSTDLPKARLGLADCHYNNGDYMQAAALYATLVYPQPNDKIRESALNGLQWACQKSKNLDYAQQLSTLASRAEDNAARSQAMAILYRKAAWEQQQQRWAEAIITSQHLLGVYPDFAKKQDVQLILANALSATGEYSQAEHIFARLYEQSSDPEVLFNWHSLLVAAGKQQKAIEKLKQACQLSAEPSYWLALLNLEKKTNHQDFATDYETWMQKSSGAPKQQAMLLWTEYSIDNANYEQANQVIAQLLKGEFPTIKAQAQYLKGLALYQQQNYQQALPELLRVRYLYPQVTQARVPAEVLAFDIYLKQGQKENATRLLDGLKEQLGADEYDALALRLQEVK